MRKRVIANYKQAGNPVEAVTVFRQAIKADPDDMDARLQLVEALVANEQVIAAQKLGTAFGCKPKNLCTCRCLGTVIQPVEKIGHAHFLQHI